MHISQVALRLFLQYATRLALVRSPGRALIGASHATVAGATLTNQPVSQIYGHAGSKVYPRADIPNMVGPAPKRPSVAIHLDAIFSLDLSHLYQTHGMARRFLVTSLASNYPSCGMNPTRPYFGA